MVIKKCREKIPPASSGEKYPYIP